MVRRVRLYRRDRSEQPARRYSGLNGSIGWYATRSQFEAGDHQAELGTTGARAGAAYRGARADGDEPARSTPVHRRHAKRTGQQATTAERTATARRTATPERAIGEAARSARIPSGTPPHP